MQINRHNYEEFFILYMDNELCNADRVKVESFIDNNPDLRDELDILSQYKLTPDTSVVYEGKEDLMKLSTEMVTLANAEEWLVLYLDNELNADQRDHFEKFLQENPILHDELASFRRVQLPLEKIDFPGKESLYHPEERTRRIIWIRIAAAAAVLIAITITAVMLFQNNSTTRSNDSQVVAKLSTTKDTSPVPVVDHSKDNSKRMDKTITPGNTGENDLHPLIASNEKVNDSHKDNHLSQSIVLKNNKIADQANSIAANDPIPSIGSNHLPAPHIDQATDEMKNRVAYISPEIKVPAKSLTNSIVTTGNNQPLYTSESAGNQDDETLDQPNGKKNKLRGFFRKITRTFEKNTDINTTEDNDKVLIGGLAIKL